MRGIVLDLLLAALCLPALAQDQGESALLFTALASPTIAYVNGCVNSASALTTNCTLGLTAGNVLVAASKTQNTSGTATPTFTTSGVACSWVRATATTQIAAGFPGNSTIYTCLIPSTASATVTITWTGQTGSQFTDISVAQYSTTAAWNNPILDRYAQASNTAASTSCATGTTPATQNANDLLLAVCQNFNSAETWGALSGWTNRATASSSTLGVYSKAVTAVGTQSATVPLSASDASQGTILALQASNVVDGSGAAVVQSANSSGQTGQFDHIAINGVIPGDTLVYYVFHNHWSGSGTTTMSDSNGNLWYPCNVNTGGAASVTMTDLQIDSVNGMACFYSLAVSVGGTVTGQPTVTDCATSCSFVGGVFMELRGVHNWEAFGHTLSGTTSTSGSNNANCGSLTTTTPNDFLICGIDQVSGTLTAGTTPLAFPALFNQANGNMEAGVWSSAGTTAPTETLTASGASYGGMALAFR